MTDTWQPTPRPTFDRGGLSLTSHDPRNRAHPVAALLAPAPLKSRRWRRWRPPWDQAGPTCVGHAWAGAVATSPQLGRLPRGHNGQRRAAVAQPLAYELYRAAQRLDEWPAEDYDGTSTLGGAKAAQEAGLIGAYRWCFGLEDVLRTLSQLGPVVTGLEWLADAAQARPDGRPDPRVGDSALGGHETYLAAVDVDRREVHGWNSWGPRFGAGGRYVWTWDYLEARLDAAGDACYAPA